MARPAIDWEALYSAAEEARRVAYAPYSRFQVGAALLTDKGTIVKGCNVENASYGLTVCAERNAINAAVLRGETPVACAIVVDSKQPTPPCGMCRQVLAEFAALDAPVRTRTVKGKKEVRSTVGKLLPFAFTPDFLLGR